MHSSHRLRRIILAVAAVILSMQGVATWRQTERAREAQLAGAEETVARIARGMEGAVNRAFVQVDSMLAGLPAILAPFLRDGTLRIADVNRVLRELNNQNLTYRDILLVARDGMPVAAAQSLSRRRPPPVAAEGAFSDLGAPGGSVLIAGPVLNPVTGEWSLFLARHVTIQGLGPVLAVAEVPVHQIQALLSVGAEGPGLRMTLERDDGTLLASLPHDETRMGQRLAPTAAMLHQQGIPDDFASRFAGRPARIAVRPTLYPTLVVTASIETEAALALWRQDRWMAVLLSGALAILVLTVALALNEWLRHRDRVEAERARARQMLENAIESMTEGFVMFDAEDRLVACNSRYRDFYHITADLIAPGAHFADIMREGARRGQYVGVADDIEGWVRDMAAWHRGNHPPMERLLPDGRWLRITERRMPDGGTVGIRTDITPMKQAMAALSAARDEAAQAAEAKGRFLARMSHELRTPLNGVLGFAQVLLNDARLAADQRQQVRTLHEAGRHLLHLVNGLLDLSKIEAGRLELEIEATPLLPVLEGCAALMHPEIERKAIAFTIEAEDGLPIAVEADPTRLRQLLLNLLSNAVKFTPAEGLVTLRATRTPDGALRFEVEDSGPGVPQEKRHLLFADFVQLGTRTSEEATGTGLGLAISARLATLMGGGIGCSDGMDGGALFWVELPLRDAATPPGGAKPRVTATGPDADAPRLSILVVDDVKANRDVAYAMLEPCGHRVTLVADGHAALAALQRHSFDVVLMDIHMPGMDGLEATRRIRALAPPTGSIPVIALTASVHAEQVAACQAAGMDAHLDKPLDRQRLLALLAASAKPRPASTAPSAPNPAPAEASLLDEARLRALHHQLGQAAPGIIAEFVSEIRRAATLLADATAEERADPAWVGALAHRLLGGARTLGAPALANDAEALQIAAKGGEPMPGLQARTVATAVATLAALATRDNSQAHPDSQAA